MKRVLGSFVVGGMLKNRVREFLASEDILCNIISKVARYNDSISEDVVCVT